MKRTKRIFLVAGIALLLGVFFSVDNFAQKQKGNNTNAGFVDLNGDGINDNAYDSDGDGIINCLDPDFVRPLDGSGRKLMKGSTYKMGKGGFGPGNGTGNQGIGPRDGTGYGQGSGTGICDGTGPKGKVSRRGGR